MKETIRMYKMHGSTETEGKTFKTNAQICKCKDCTCKSEKDSENDECKEKLDKQSDETI